MFPITVGHLFQDRDGSVQLDSSKSQKLFAHFLHTPTEFLIKSLTTTRKSWQKVRLEFGWGAETARGNIYCGSSVAVKERTLLKESHDGADCIFEWDTCGSTL